MLFHPHGAAPSLRVVTTDPYFIWGKYIEEL